MLLTIVMHANAHLLPLVQCCPYMWLAYTNMYTTQHMVVQGLPAALPNMAGYCLRHTLIELCDTICYSLQRSLPADPLMLLLPLTT